MCESCKLFKNEVLGNMGITGFNNDCYRFLRGQERNAAS